MSTKTRQALTVVFALLVGAGSALGLTPPPVVPACPEPVVCEPVAPAEPIEAAPVEPAVDAAPVAPAAEG